MKNRITRRSFIAKSTLTFAGLSVINNSFSALAFQRNTIPVVISTWQHGLPANEAAWEVLSEGGYSLDAVETGIRVPESDPDVITVGYGGIPDARGKVTLDASIMDEKGRAGSVAYLQKIMHPVSVARLILEKSPHVMLSGKGAQKFALQNGFKKDKLRTKQMKRIWKEWKKSGGGFNSQINIGIQPENHDTIGMLAIDEAGRISGASSTSGMAFKTHGRVGDSPIIGAGLFVDGKVGGAVATGSGELVMKTLGSFLVVELMRSGRSPKEACEEAVVRITEKIPEYQNHQIGYLALNTAGSYGAFSLKPGFDFAVKNRGTAELKEAESWLKKL